MIFHGRNHRNPSNNEKKEKVNIKNCKDVHYDYNEKDEINYNMFKNITKYCCNRNMCDSFFINDELINWEKEDKSTIKKKINYDNTFKIKFQDNHKSDIFTNNLIQKNNVVYNYSKEPLNLTSPLRGKDDDIFVSSNDIDKSKNPTFMCERKIKNKKKLLTFYNECPIINNTFISFDEDTLLKKDIHINNKIHNEFNASPASKPIYYDENNNFNMYHSNNKGNHPNEDVNKENILLKNEEKYMFNNDKGNKYFQTQDRSIFLYTPQNYIPMESKQDIESNLILYKHDTYISSVEKNNDEYIPRYSSNNICKNNENILSITSKKNSIHCINDISLYDQLITHNNQSNVLYSKPPIVVSKEDIDKINCSYISLMDIKSNEKSTQINISSKKKKKLKKNKKKLKNLYKKVKIKTPVNMFYKRKKKLKIVKKKIKTDKRQIHEGNKKIYYVTKGCLKEKRKKRKKLNEKVKKAVKTNNIKNGIKGLFYKACNKKNYREKIYFYKNNTKNENKIRKCNRSRKKKTLNKRKAVMIPLKVKKDDEKCIRNILSFNALNHKKNYISSKEGSNKYKNKNFIKRNNNIKKIKINNNNNNNNNNNTMCLDKAISNIIHFTNKGKMIKSRGQSYSDIANNHNIENEDDYMTCDKNNIKYERKEILNKENEHTKKLKYDYINSHIHNNSTNNSPIIKGSNKENEKVPLQSTKYKDVYMVKNKINVACTGKTDKYNIKGYYFYNNEDLDDTKQELSEKKITSLENRILHDYIVQNDSVYVDSECKKININGVTSVFKNKAYKSKNDKEKVYECIRDNNSTKFHILQSVAYILNQGKEKQRKKDCTIKMKDTYLTFDNNFINKNNYNKYNNHNNHNNHNNINNINNINNCNINLNGHLMKEYNSFNTKKFKRVSSCNVHTYDKIKENNERPKRSFSHNSYFEKKKFCVNQNRNQGTQKYIMKVKNMILFKNNILTKDFLFDSSFSSDMNIERETLYILNSILFYSYKLKNRLNILINKQCNNTYFLQIKLYILCLIKLIEKYKLDPHSLCIKKSKNIIRKIIKKIKYYIMNLPKVIIEITTFETCLIKIYTIELMMRSLLFSSSLVLDDEHLLKLSYNKNGILLSCCSEILNRSLPNEDNNKLDEKKIYIDRTCRLKNEKTEKTEKIYLLKCTGLKKGYVKKMIFNGISLKDIHTIMYKFDGKSHVLGKKKKKNYNIDECETLQQLNECLNLILANKKPDIFKGVNNYYNKLKEYNEELSLINDLKNEDNHLVKDFLDDMNMYEFSNLLNYYIKRKYVHKTCGNNKIRKKKQTNHNDTDKSYKNKSAKSEGIIQILHDFYLKE
ncbi:conserved Plasmodium protein, unknown function [Plasmodium reichenowi]|uniref:Uncharacterized protein n=1 Tax=Plasmodium reichenowi TaxID=5854 RepID=A0A2P9DD33_PLARE|nr:conserved Plasmodium protein, unknown function [Plasmodium reichenowi]